jgi:hypothetical protein
MLEQRLWHRTSGTSAYSHTYGDHDDSRNPVSSRDAEVDGFGQGSGNSATWRRVAVVIPVSYVALWEATQERERGRGRWPGLGRCTMRWWEEAMEEGSWDVLFISPPGAPLYIVGRGCTLLLPQGTRRRQPRRRRRAAAATAGAVHPPQKP